MTALRGYAAMRHIRSASTSWGPEGRGCWLSSASSRPCSRWSGFRVRVRVRFRVGVKVSSPAAGCAPRRSGCEPTRGAAPRPRPRPQSRPRRTPTHNEGPRRRRRRRRRRIRRIRLRSGRAARHHLVRVRVRVRVRFRVRLRLRLQLPASRTSGDLMLFHQPVCFVARSKASSHTPG